MALKPTPPLLALGVLPAPLGSLPTPGLPEGVLKGTGGTGKENPGQTERSNGVLVGFGTMGRST